MKETARWQQLRLGWPLPLHQLRACPNTCYQVEIIIDPLKDHATMYAKNLTVGGTWTVLLLGSLNTLSAGLIRGKEDPSLYDGFQISGSPGAQFDSMSAQLYLYPASPVSSYAPQRP